MNHVSRSPASPHLPLSPSPAPPISRSPFRRLWPTAIVFVMFIADSAIHTPVPAVNEPQYLGKARHLWDPGWAAGDFFLESSNPHWMFYAATGWLARFMSLEATAWVARVMGYALLAFGWGRLVRSLLGSSILGIPAAGVFLLLASLGNLSGEWLVGGIEGKVFSYGCLFAGLSAWLEKRPIPACAWLGVAIAFHPIVGAWGVACGAVVELNGLKSGGERMPIPWSRVLLGAFVLAVCALPGLIPALTTLGGVTPEGIARATYMQVFIRLRHHLDPTTFSTNAWLAYAGMLACCGFAWWHAFWDAPPRVLTPRNRWFAGFVIATTIVAVAGAVVGWHFQLAWTMPLRDLRGFLLKFYPFRLADVFIPFAFSLALVKWLCLRPGQTKAAIIARSIGLGIVALGVGLAIPAPDGNPSGMSSRRLADWIAVAEWVGDETPPGSVIVTPTHHWGFRWYADRAEYVNYKDAPQDAAGLLEWERRLAVVRAWWESSATGFFSQDDLRRLGEVSSADYLVTMAMADRFEPRPVYDNGTYRVYRLSREE